MLAEHADLLKVLRGARKKLRSISLELDRLLGIEMFDTGADPLGIADRLEKLVSSVEAAGPLVKKHPDLPRNRVFSNGVAQQLAREVLRVFGENGILTTVSSNCMASPLIATLSSIGEAMDLHLAANTWKNVVSKARKEQHAFDQ